MSSPLSKFVKDYSFYRIQSAKTITLVYYCHKTNRHYLKSKEAFIEEIYDIALTYGNNDINILQEIRSVHMTNKKDESQILYEYLLTHNCFKRIQNIKFKPINDKEIKEDDLLFFNEFRPTKYFKPNFNNGCKDKTKFPAHKKLILNLCANDEKAYEYVLKVLSHSLKNPHIKRHGYLVFQGKGGSGKGSFNDLILEPIFKEYFIEEDENGIGGRFNSESFNKLWIVINEKEGTDISSLIKRLTGSSTGSSERKGFDRQKVEDYRNIIICTNQSDLGLDLKEDDRRATILGFSKPLGGHKDKAPIVRKYLEEEIPKERENFISYLKNLEFDISEIYTSYENNARSQLISISMNNVELFIEEIKRFEGETFNVFLNEIEFKIESLELLSNKNKNWIKVSDIYEIFEKFCRVKERFKNKDNKFFHEFYNKTGLKSVAIKKQGKGKLKYIDIQQFLKYFKLKNTLNTQISTDYKKEELTIDLSKSEVQK